MYVLGKRWAGSLVGAYARLASIGGGADEIMLGIICKLDGTLPRRKAATDLVGELSAQMKKIKPNQVAAVHERLASIVSELELRLPKSA